MSTIEEKILSKYLGALKLAEAGIGGEKEAAKKTVARLEGKYAGIKHEAKMWEFATAGKHRDPKLGGLDNFMGYAKAFYVGLSDFVEKAVDAQAGAVLASEAQSNSRLTKAGNVLITVKMDLADYKRALQLNPAQKEAFQLELTELFALELADLLGEEEEEEEA